MPAHHARASFNCHDPASGTLVVNTLHLEVDTLTDPPNWPSIAADVLGWLKFPYLAMLPTSYRFDELVVNEEDYPGTQFGQGSVAVNQAGNLPASDTDLSIAICGLVSYKTNVAKRYARGHMFAPPPLTRTETAAGGTWSTSGNYWPALQTWATTLVAGHTVSSTSYTPEVFSRTRIKQGHPDFAFKIITAQPSSVQHFLRSRLTSP